MSGTLAITNAVYSVSKILHAAVFTYTDTDGTITSFEYTKSINGGEAYLSSIVDKDNNTLTVTYNSTQISTITATSPLLRSGTAAHMLQFAWSQVSGVPVITSVTEYGSETSAETQASQSWTYSYANCGTYTANGSNTVTTDVELAAVSSPIDPNNSNASDISLAYAYNAANSPLNAGLLKKIKDQNFDNFDGGKGLAEQTFDYYPNNRALDTADTGGAREYFFYDTYGENLIDSGGSTQYVADYVQVQHSDILGNQTTYEYDTNGELTKTINPDGTSVENTYDAHLRLTQTIDELGRVQQYQYYGLTDLVGQTNEFGDSYTATFSSRTFTDSYQVASGPFTSATYIQISVQGTSTVQAVVPKYTYTAYQPVSGVTNVKTTVYAYDKYGNVTAEIDPNQDATLMSYGTNGYGGLPEVVWQPNQVQMVASSSASNVVNVYGTYYAEEGSPTSYTYDGYGNVLTQYNANTGNTSFGTTYTYDTFGFLASSTNGTLLTSYTNNPIGEPLTITLSGVSTTGGVTLNTYVDGLKTQMLSPAPNSTAPGQYVTNTYSYNDEKQLSSTTTSTSAASVTTSQVYDADGNLIESIDGLGQTTMYVRDWAGRVVQTINPDGSSTFTRYDGAGRVVATIDGNGNETTTTYDAFNQPTEIVNALGQITTNTYDQATGELLSTVNASGSTIDYGYDALGRVVLTVNQGVSVSGVAYDKDGNVIQNIQYPLAQLAISSPTNATLPTNSGARITTYAYDALDRLISTTDPAGATTVTQYGTDGKVASTTLGSKGFTAETTQYFYNALDQLAAVVEPPVTGYSSTIYPTNLYTYDLAGNVIKQELSDNTPEQMTTFSYDFEGRLTATQRVIAFDTIVTTLTSYNTTVTTLSSYNAAGEVTSTTDGNGQTTTYTYDAMGRVTSEQEPAAASGQTTPITTYSYDENGNLIQTSDPKSIVTDYAYDGLNRQIGIGQNMRTVDFIAISSSGTLATVSMSQTLSLGELLMFTAQGEPSLDDFATVVGTPGTGASAATSIGSAVMISGTVVVQFQNSATLLAAQADVLAGAGTETLYGIDEVPVATVEEPTGSSSALGNRTVDLFSLTAGQQPPNVNVTLTIDPAGVATATYSDAAGRTTEVDMFQPTVVGSVTSGLSLITSSPGYSNTFTMISKTTYNQFGDVASTTDGVGDTTNYTYDSDGRKLTETDPDVHTTSYTYDAAGNLLSTVNPSGIVTTDVYDQENQLIEQTTPSQSGMASTYYYYNAAGNQTDVVDPTGAHTLYSYDDLGRLVATHLPINARGAVSPAAEVLTYDNDNNILTRTDPDGNITTYSYDNLDRLIHESEKIGSTTYTTTNTYDFDGNIIESTDFDGRSTFYTYDAFNRQVSELWLGGRETITSIYDPDGRVVEQTDGTTTELYGYDNAGDLSFDDTSVDGQDTQVFDGYNPAGEETLSFAMTYSSGNNFSWSGVNVYSYNGDGELQTARQYDALVSFQNVATNTQNTLPSGILNTFAYVIDISPVLDTSYNVNDGQDLHPTEVDPEQVNFAYTPDGSVSTISRSWGLGTGTPTQYSAPITTYSYDSAGLLTSIATAQATAHLTTYGFTSYDADNRLQTETYSNSQASGGTGTYSFSYTAAGQLSSAIYPTSTNSYTYDANGNRSGSAPVDNEVANDGTYSYTYDADGNVLTQTGGGVTIHYTWDYRDRLTQVAETDNGATTTITYGYDFENRRIAENVATSGGTQSYRYVYDGSNVMLALNGFPQTGGSGTDYLPDPTDATGSAPLAEQPVNLAGFPGQEQGPPPSWLLPDQNGSVQDVVQVSAAGTASVVDHVMFDAFGNKIVPDTGNGATTYNTTAYGNVFNAPSGQDILATFNVTRM